MQLAYVFGRTPQLALQELEVTATIFPFQWLLTSVPPIAARLKPDSELLEADWVKDGSVSSQSQELLSTIQTLQRRLGGTVRTVYLHQQVEASQLADALKDLARQLAHTREGKLTFGISVLSTGTQPPALQPMRLGLTVKKMLRDEEGRSVRVVFPTEENILNAAQVIHNRLIGKGFELFVLEEAGKWWVGYSLSVQDIEDYRIRDFSIPRPDPVSGMLSPKLAQSMINLAVQGAERATIYDPFCGNGRILLEASFMGFTAKGSDIREQQVEASKENVHWLMDHYRLEVPTVESNVWQADATDLSARPNLEKGWFLVTEPYLGKPLRAALPVSEKESWLKELEDLYLKFFTVWSAEHCPVEKRPERMMVVVPRARLEGGGEVALYDRLVDRLQQMGYSSTILFCYDRPDSQVRRDLVSLVYS